jgi:branched-chain amino acid transport system substrate-binding protein
LGRRSRLARPAPALILALAVSVVGPTLGGCGAETGVSSGATVSVYLSAPMRGPEASRGRTLCTEAKRALASAGGKAGDLQVRLSCLDASGPAGPWTLARVGANARRATQDSTTVAYISEPDPKARQQSRPILEEANIAEVHASSGTTAMRRILQAIEAADPDSLRESVSEELTGS